MIKENNECGNEAEHADMGCDETRERSPGSGGCGVTCSAGYMFPHQSKPCTCAQCHAGYTWKDGRGDHDCYSCAKCGSGTTQLSDCSRTANRRCGCQSGHYNLRCGSGNCNDGGTLVCSRCTSCGEGTQQVASTASTRHTSRRMRRSPPSLALLRAAPSVRPSSC